MAAICSGSNDTVFALLEEKADPNLKSKRHGKPLEKAAGLGYSCKEIVKDLLEFKAEADLSPQGGQVHVLHNAAMYDMHELAAYCLDKGCNIDVITTKGPRYHPRFDPFADEMTPLAYACAEGHLGMVKLLLRRGASLGPQEDPSAVLWIAANQGYAEVVETLISTFKSGPDAEATAKFIDQKPFPRSSHPILFAAVSAASPETIRILLEAGAKYQSNRHQATPLFATATKARPNVAKILLDHHRLGRIDVCINQRANNGRTALWEACELNRQRIVEQLIDAGADYTIPDNDDATPLHASTHHDHIGVLSFLIGRVSGEKNEAVLDKWINARAKSGQTALVHAVARNRPLHVKMLLDCGADYTISGLARNSPLHWASRAGNDAITKLLLERAEQGDKGTQRLKRFLDLKNREGRTALFHAAAENKLSTVQLLLDHFADYTVANDINVTALHSASYAGFKDVVLMLLDHSSQDPNPTRFASFLNHRNIQGKTALMDSVQPRSGMPALDITRLLLERGANYTIPKSYKITLLHVACFNGHEELVVLLLTHASQDQDPSHLRSFLNHRNHWGTTALMDAVRTRVGMPFLNIIRVLLEHGADPRISRIDDVTTLHSACYNGHIEVVRLLLAHASQNEGESEGAFLVDDTSRFQYFLNRRNRDGKTALIDAAQTNQTEIIDILLDHGADFSIGDNKNRTALHYSVATRDLKLVRFLLERVSARSEGIDDSPTSMDLVTDIEESGGQTPKTLPIKPYNAAIGTSTQPATNIQSTSGEAATDIVQHSKSMHRLPSTAASPPRTPDPVGYGSRTQESFPRFIDQQSTDTGRSALHDAADLGLVDICALLLEFGADLQCCDSQGMTPYQYALPDTPGGRIGGDAVDWRSTVAKARANGAGAEKVGEGTCKVGL